MSSSPTAASTTRQTSDRRGNSEDSGGLNPRRIQTGVPGLRRTVYDGALRVSNDAYAILTTSVADVAAASSAAANNNHSNGSNNNGINNEGGLGGVGGVGGVNNVNLQAKPEWRTHFPLNALIRPSCDDTHHDEFNIPSSAASLSAGSNNATKAASTVAGGSRTNKKRKVLSVTKLHNEKVTIQIPKIINEQTGERTMISMDTIQTVSCDLLVGVLDAPHHEEEEETEVVGGSVGVEGGNPNGGEEVLSLRGGGDEGDGEDVSMDVGGVVGGNNNNRGGAIVTGAAGGDGEGNAGGNNQDDVVMAEAVNNASAVGGGDGGTTTVGGGDVVEGGGSSGGEVIGTVAAKSNNAVVENNNTAGEVQMEAVAAPAVTTTIETNPVAAAPPAAAAVANAEQLTAATVNSDEKVQQVSSGVQQQQGGGVADVPSSSTPQVVATAPAPAPPAAESAPTTTTTAENTTSSATANEATAAPEATTVKSTDIHPLPTVHPPLSTSIPTSTTTSEDDPNPANIYRPSWYDIKTISNVEKSSLPEWFNSSAPHRTPTTYLSTRNQILTIYSKQASLALATAHQGGGGQHYLTVSAIRRIVPGDVGSLTRLHTFLCDSGMMNVGHVGENAPSDLALRGGSSSGKGKRSFEEVRRSTVWSKERLEELDGLVVKYAKSSGGDAAVSVEGAPPQPQPPQASVDWEAVANEIGEGVSAADCQRAFLDPPKVDDVSVKIAKTPGGFDLSTIVDGVHPDVLNATINASLKATNDVVEARKASIAGIIASAAVMKGQSEEEEIAQTLMDILDQRMQRLENRVAILDDVEALLEAERVALELERRDMYTTRCRHWFGDGSS